MISVPNAWQWEHWVKCFQICHDFTTDQMKPAWHNWKEIKTSIWSIKMSLKCFCKSDTCLRNRSIFESFLITLLLPFTPTKRNWDLWFLKVKPRWRLQQHLWYFPVWVTCSEVITSGLSEEWTEPCRTQCFQTLHIYTCRRGKTVKSGFKFEY